LLQKAQLANTSYQKYIAALEAELSVWRSGGHVEQSEWATSAVKGGAAAPPPKKSQTSPALTPSNPTPSASRSMTPVIPSVEGLKADLESRPQTPTVVGLDKDERDEFLKRENELSDALAEKESALVAAGKLVKELKEELAFLKDQEAAVSKVCLFRGRLKWFGDISALGIGEQVHVNTTQRVTLASREAGL
jgi:kinesin family protein 5